MRCGCGAGVGSDFGVAVGAAGDQTLDRGARHPTRARHDADFSNIPSASSLKQSDLPIPSKRQISVGV
jgi:hypothetical protein